MSIKWQKVYLEYILGVGNMSNASFSDAWMASTFDGGRIVTAHFRASNMAALLWMPGAMERAHDNLTVTLRSCL